MTRLIRRSLIGVALVAGAGAATLAIAANEPLPALTKLMPGQWELKEIGGIVSRSVCLSDFTQVMQVEHTKQKCTQSVLDSGARAATVRYVCPGVGSGRSTVTVFTPKSFKLETQGMAGGAPFAVDYNATRTGDCAGDPIAAKATGADLTKQ